MNRYIKNQNMLTSEENHHLQSFRVAVAGCGGLGGYIIEMLARLGIGHITAIDGDVFDTSNLNRQLLSHPGNLGKSKAVEAKHRVEIINPDISLKAVSILLTEENAADILAGHHVICDALDSIKSKLILQYTAEGLKIPLVHAAIAGWYAQVCTIMPGDRTLERIYEGNPEQGEENDPGNPSFTPALAAALEVAEVLKILLAKEGILRHKLLTIDTLKQDFNILEI
ncbi:MAG: HesA/MoeB/ThiF family protein [Sphingobacteriia bacterium]|nr:HesA/MoeB/ThiF family protein [Sphingobacteriia bacterium]